MKSQLFSAKRWRSSPAGLRVLAIAAGLWLLGSLATSQAQTISADTLRSMTPELLESYYRSGSVPVGLPAGDFQGIPLVASGKPLGPALSRAARAVWQGKVVRPDGSTAVNRFFGLPLIEGRLYSGTSWLDEAPALILDYQGTSRVWNRYRDEIRQIGPNLYLGYMYSRDGNNQVSQVRAFAFEIKP